MHFIVFGGLGHLEEKMFNALVTDYISGHPVDSLWFDITDAGSPVGKLATKLANNLGIWVAVTDWDIVDTIEMRNDQHHTIMLAVHDEDPEMLKVMDICRKYGLDPLDICIGLIPLFELMSVK